MQARCRNKPCGNKACCKALTGIHASHFFAKRFRHAIRIQQSPEHDHDRHEQESPTYVEAGSNQQQCSHFRCIV